MSDAVLCSANDRGVATVTLNRPDRHNAFDDRLILALTEVLLTLNKDPAIRAVVLTGAGTSFSSGADLQWMRSMATYGEEENLEDALRLAELLTVLNGLAKPTVARVNGAAIGGGVGLVACCDIALAASTAKFALTEVRLGLVPAVISPYVIAAVGARHARRLFLTGATVDATRARALGLVHEIAEPDTLDALVEAEVALLLRGGPVAQREAKELAAMVTEAAGTPRLTLMRRTATLIARLRGSPEGQEGLTAFLEKRSPNWRR